MSRRPSLRALSILLVLAVPAAALADASRYDVVPGGNTRVSFTSDAPLETIHGRATSVRGQVTLDPDNLAATRGRIEVPVSALRTGSGLRDEHLRADNWLDAARHPKIVFEITGVSGASALRPGAVTRVQVRGRFTLHGVTHTVTAPAEVQYRAASGDAPAEVRVRARFTVNLPAHGVSVPTLVRLKVSDEIAVEVRVALQP
jgi:polyisoprenoid-binding protein YceI